MARVNIFFFTTPILRYSRRPTHSFFCFQFFFFSFQFLQFIHTTPQKMYPRFAFAALSYLPLLVSATPLYTTTTTGWDDAYETSVYPAGFTPTSWVPCGDCLPAAVTAASQLVTVVKKDILTTSFYASTTGVYTPPHQTSVWTVDKTDWVTVCSPPSQPSIFLLTRRRDV